MAARGVCGSVGLNHVVAIFEVSTEKVNKLVRSAVVTRGTLMPSPIYIYIYQNIYHS